MDEFRGQAYDGAHAAGDGDDGQAQVHGGVVGQFEAHAAFLRDVHFVGEQLGHDHQPQDDAAADIGGERFDGFQEAVGAEADLVGVADGFNMHIGRLSGDGAGEDSFDDGSCVHGGLSIHGGHLNRAREEREGKR